MILLSGRFTAERLMNCNVCGVSFLSRHSVDVQRISPKDIEVYISADMPNIPVGWSMNGREDIRCPTCRDWRPS